MTKAVVLKVTYFSEPDEQEETQRFWENQIGRTPSFWHVTLPWFKQQFPDSPDWTPEDLNKIAKEMPFGFTGSHIQDIVNQANYIVTKNKCNDKKIINNRFSLLGWI